MQTIIDDARYVQWEDDASFRAMFDDQAAKAHMHEVRSLALSVDPVHYDVVYAGSAARRDVPEEFPLG